eukprot:6086210-Amphidinium_carterae.1
MPGSTVGRASTIGSLHPPGLSHVSGISSPGVACFGATASPYAGIGAPGVTSTNPQPGTPAFSGQGGHHTCGGNPDESGGRFKATPWTCEQQLIHPRQCRQWKIYENRLVSRLKSLPASHRP